MTVYYVMQEMVFLVSEESSLPLDIFIDSCGPSETSSFVSESSGEMDADSNNASDEERSIRSIGSELSLKSVDNGLIRLRRAIDARDSDESSSASFETSSSTLKPARGFRLSQFARSQASLDGFIASDSECDEEEEIANSSDRAFLTSSDPVGVNDITMYRLLDKSQRWEHFSVECSQSSIALTSQAD